MHPPRKNLVSSDNSPANVRNIRNATHFLNAEPAAAPCLRILRLPGVTADPAPCAA
jgi:hypothetical protein